MKCLAILSLVFASTIFASCCSIQGMKEPQKTIIYKYFARRSTPITIVQCFEKKFYSEVLKNLEDPKNLSQKDSRMVNNKASKILSECTEEFEANKEQFGAWEDFLEELENQHRSEIVF